MATVNEELLDAAIRHAIFIERFKGGEARKLVEVYNRLADDIVAALAKRDPWAVIGRYRTARLVKLLEDIQAVLKQHGQGLRLDIMAKLDQFATVETGFLAKMMQSAIPAAIQLDVARPSAALVRAAIRSNPFNGRLMREWFDDLATSTFNRLRDQVRISVLEGETIGQASSRVRSAIDVSRRGAEMVARTAISHTVAEAKDEQYRANRDIIKAIRWVSTLDGRTSAICRARDGALFMIGEGPRPPAHPNCRSTTVAVLKSLKELGFKKAKDLPESTRASMDGQVPESTTYAEWLAGKSAAFQDEVLGPTKGRLFRTGGLTLDKFVTREESELNLDQLRAKYADAFALAGL